MPASARGRQLLPLSQMAEDLAAGFALGFFFAGFFVGGGAGGAATAVLFLR